MSPAAAIAATPSPEPAAQPSGTHGSLAGALAAFQLTVPAVTKGNDAKIPSDKGSSYSYSYADLADVTRIVLPALAANGLSWTCAPTMRDGAFVLHYRLMHDSGEVLEGFYPLGAPGGKAQATGSAITYGRRYCLLAITGVCPDDEDDDGHAASQAQQRGGPQRPTPAPAPRRQQPTVENRTVKAASYILGAIDPEAARKRAAWLEEQGLVDQPCPDLPGPDRDRYRLDEGGTLGSLATAVIEHLDDIAQTATLLTAEEADGDGHGGPY